MTESYVVEEASTALRELARDFPVGIESDTGLSVTLSHMPDIHISLVDVALVPIRWGKKLIMAKIAKETEGSYSSKGLYKAMTKAIERVEKKVDKLLVKDLESANSFFTSALAHVKDGNFEEAQRQFKEAHRLAIEAFSTLDPMKKIACTDIRICAAAGCMNDEAFFTEINSAFTRLIAASDTDRTQEEIFCDSGSYWLTSSQKANYALKCKFCNLLVSTFRRSPCDEGDEKFTREMEAKENELENLGNDLNTPKEVLKGLQDRWVQLQAEKDARKARAISKVRSRGPIFFGMMEQPGIWVAMSAAIAASLRRYGPPSSSPMLLPLFKIKQTNEVGLIRHEYCILFGRRD